MVEAERRHHQVEAAVTEGQRDRVGGDRAPAVAAPQHALGKVDRHDPARPRGQGSPPGHAGARPRSSTRRPASGTGAAATSTRASCAYIGPGAVGPVLRRGVVTCAHPGGQLSIVQLSRAAARTEFVSHHASSSS